jgi:copper chaperone CopZ
MNTKLKIENACCEGCKASIEKYTKDIPGLKSFVFDIQTKIANLVHDENLDINVVIKKIGSIGKGNYKASIM